MKKQHLAALSVLGSLAILYLRPLVFNLASLPGSSAFGEASEYVWAFQHSATALSLGENPLFTQSLFAPFGTDLRFGTIYFFQTLLGLPFTLVFGAVVSANLILVATQILNSALTYALLYRFVRNVPAALVGTVFIVYSFQHLVNLSVGRTGLAALWLISAILLTLDAMLTKPRLSTSLALGMFVLAALFSDFQIILFAALLALPFALYRIVSNPRLVRAKTILLFLIAGLWFCIPFALVFYPVLTQAIALGYKQANLSDLANYSNNAFGIRIPAFWGATIGFELIAGTVLAVLLCARRAATWFWLAVAILLFALSFGPFFPPYTWFAQVPALSQFRTPFRLVIPAAFAFGILTALALAQLSAWLETRRVGTLLAWIAALVLCCARVGLAASDVRVETHQFPEYTFYSQLANAPSHSLTILQVPFGIRDGWERMGNGGETLQFYYTIHRQNIVGGGNARLPQSVFAAYRAHPALRFLGGEAVSDAEFAQDLDAVLRWTNADYIVVHRTLLSPAEQARILPLLERQFGQSSKIEKDLVIYQVPPLALSRNAP